MSIAPPLHFLAGGETGALMRSMDWSRTGLGPVESWPQSLRSAVDICLGSRFPIVIYWGPDLAVLYNDAYAEILGRKHPWALGRPCREVWSEIWDIIAPMLDGVLESGEATWSDDRLLVLQRRDYAEECYFSFSFSPVRGAEGGVEGIFTAVIETTRRVLGERRLRILRDLATRSAAAKDEELAWRSAIEPLESCREDFAFALLYRANADGKTAQLVGAAGIDQLAGQAPPAIDLASAPAGVWPEDHPPAAVLPVAKPGAPAYGYLIAGLNPRRPLDDEYRGFLDLVAEHVATGIANARAHDEERKRAEALVELDRVKTAFFSNVSHEFRTPLTLLLGPLEDALAAADDDAVSAHRRSLETAHRNSLRLLKLVNTLLDFARIEAGRAKASYEPTDLAALTAELASNFRSACERGGLELRIDCRPLPEPVYVDLDMWEKIVLNLVSNAFKFTLHGAITVSLEARGDRIELSVRDTGIGIAADELPRLFERFHRIEAAGRTHEGSGIGLAFVRELARLHGGAVQAASVPGEGSTFTVSLPLGHAHLPAERVGAARSLASTGYGAAPYVEEALRWLPDELPDHGRNEALPAPGAQAPRARILWADDNADMREYVARLLGELYDVEAVADGEAALAAMRAIPPDLVLADIMMPRLDGIGLARALRADERLQSIPVIIVSARVGEEARIEGMQAGADDYLVKPFTARDLLSRVGAHLQSARIRREAAAALRESETRFRNMADHSPVMIRVTEPDASCGYLNRTWYEFTGQAPAAALGFGWVDAVHPEDRAYAHSTFVTASAKGEAFRFEYRLRRYDGEYRFAIDAAAPRRGSGGEFLGYVGSVIDITELKQVEAELREADRRKDEFLAMLGHELRNPLAPIVTAVGLLAEADGDDALIGQARGILSRQTRHLVRLVDDLLELSRVSRGRIRLRMGEVALADVVAEAVEAARPLVSAAHHALEVDLPGEPLLVHADAVRLVQVIANLVNNATKYTPPGGRIAISAWAEDGSAAISVRDNGIGIAPEMIDRVFEMFVQGNPLGSAYQAGLGIGLSLARTLVQMQGGSINARSDGSGRGSEFTVRLPLLASRGHEASVRPSVAVRAGAPQRVLVVDDNVDAAQSIGALLGRMGHEVHVVHNGRSALETAAASPPDLVLLDIGLPDLDGLGVAARLRSDPRLDRVRIVALTGHGREVDRERTRRAGFHAHLLKPVSPEDLREVLREPQPAADLQG